MTEFGFTEYVAAAAAAAFAISVPFTLVARLLFARNAHAKANIARFVYIKRQVRIFIALVVLQIVLDIALVSAFAWILYLAATASAREFVNAVLPIWGWVLVLSAARVVLELPIRGIIRGVREANLSHKQNFAEFKRS